MTMQPSDKPDPLKTVWKKISAYLLDAVTQRVPYAGMETGDEIADIPYGRLRDHVRAEP
ncbi:MAG: hypothetical protein AAGI50_04105 [Pseudomonadota bacterium]